MLGTADCEDSRDYTATAIDEVVDAIERLQPVPPESETRAQKRKEAEQQKLMKLLEERLIARQSNRYFRMKSSINLLTEDRRAPQDPYSVVEQIIGTLRFQRLNIS